MFDFNSVVEDGGVADPTFSVKESKNITSCISIKRKGNSVEYIPAKFPRSATLDIGRYEEDEQATGTLQKLNVKGVNRILFENGFFSVIQKRDETEYLRRMEGILVQCRICPQKIKGSLGVSSNFIRHLRLYHENEFKQYEQRKKIEMENKPKKTNDFDERVLMFLAATYSPLSTVEKPEFKNLFKGLQTEFKSRRVMADILEEKHLQWLAETKDLLNTVQYYCTTVDVWSVGEISFLGYTCHWLCPTTFKRSHIALACRRFKGSPTYDRIAQLIASIHEEFNLEDNKLQLTITDNGANFCKAFKEYGLTAEESIDSSSDSAEESFVEEGRVKFVDTPLELPQYFRCASHTLNLLSSTDFLNIIKQSKKLYSRHKQAFMRCYNIWQKCARPKSATLRQGILLSSSLKTPRVTCWNSLFESVQNLLAHKDKLSILCTALNIAKFTPPDIEYLESYAKLMEPIASAIDFLQNEENMYFGNFIAALMSLKVKLGRLQETNELSALSPICGEMINCLTKRFKTYFEGDKESEVAIVATMTCPALKLRFLPVLQRTAPQLSAELLKDWFLKYSAHCCDYTETSSELPALDMTNSFLDFGDTKPDYNNLQRDGARQQFETYLLDKSTSLNSLQNYSLVKDVFLKCNTAITSSAPVERLFAFREMVDATSGENLSDKNFERLALIRVNNLN
ncbi:uncharacterized protein LOC118746724 isoform X1 [Rhagoletis pomonella]|uniref:uncharacterized protein LOC118746724 isoform X1 n=2 Tax=Rhagoletis pomonella TaxID=28610 RepID=UPI001780F2AD|nr:uncharacterized protein LOC118746724 isoform X1 [Rhagoletis pomonella]